ncbi:AlpA family transcriptional regulator [Mycolicibacterium sp. HK-90]|uniref:helix-turn-helix transcriptional regulator n=1 Tax=Mycolicibacterium sp. HK-90 TaxID=3056937 RepID=UPI002659353D|nr:helix-turn-helix domain-containing protein [Mycolicibacterium sp. HK-90]WKG03057.1 helix-turn-helix domain-containing protein [Mycolicibacterium sp. HK-90]
MDFLNVKQASVMTGVAEATLRYWRSVDEGPPSFKLGGRVVYRREAVEQWITEQEKATSRGGSA